MIRRRHAILLALGLVAPLALVDSPAGALDQDLVVTPTAGPPGTAITLSSASCTPSGGDSDAYMEASLYVGTGATEKIAAFAQGESGGVVLTVPDWVDPEEPAVIEASCYVWTEDDEQSIDYTPVAFDIEPGSGTPVQVRTFSRTEMLAGQAFSVTGNCGPEMGNAEVYGVVGAGTDQTGRDLGEFAGEGYTATDSDGTFSLDVYVSNATIGFGVGGDGDDISDVEIYEDPMDLPAGDYTAFVYCSADSDGSVQFLEPQALVLTGSARTGDIDLTSATGTRNVTLTGISEVGDATGSFDAIGLEEFGPDRSQASDARPSGPFGRDGGDGPTPFRAQDGLVGGSTRVLPDGGTVDFQVTPGANGVWEVRDSTEFGDGFVIAFASAGDPFADGFLYDPQAVLVDEQVPTTTVPPTVPVTTPYAPPASVVQGTPTYAG